MITKDDIKYFSRLSGISEKTIENAISATDEVSLNPDPDRKSFSKSELISYTKDIRNSAIRETETTLKESEATKYEEGKKAAMEMAVRDLKKEKGYDFTGRDFHKMVEFIEEQSKAKVQAEFEKQIADLTKASEETKTLLETKETELNDTLKSIKDKNIALFKKDVLSKLNFPVPEKYATDEDKIKYRDLKNRQAELMFNAEYEVRETDEGTLYLYDKINDAELKDKVHSELVLEFAERNMLPINIKDEQSNGRGTRDDASQSSAAVYAGAKNLTDLIDLGVKAGHQPNTPEMDSFVAEGQKILKQ